MERTLTYQIPEDLSGLKISQFLRRQGYSLQNLTDLKKMNESILLNGEWAYLNQRLSVGDHLLIHIQENESSEKIPPVDLPLDGNADPSIPEQLYKFYGKRPCLVL